MSEDLDRRLARLATKADVTLAFVVMVVAIGGFMLILAAFRSA